MQATTIDIRIINQGLIRIWVEKGPVLLVVFKKEHPNEIAVVIDDKVTMKNWCDPLYVEKENNTRAKKPTIICSNTEKPNPIPEK